MKVRTEYPLNSISEGVCHYYNNLIPLKAHYN